jgi:hypothetical protein
MSDDKGYEVVDKRAAAEEPQEPEAKPEPEVEAPAEPAEEPAEEAPEHEHNEEAHSADVHTVVTWMIGMLATSAWQTMGLQVDPASGKVVKDLEQAKLAIDCAMALADRITGHLDENGRRELRGIISDLQINFVNQSKVEG